MAAKQSASRSWIDRWTKYLALFILLGGLGFGIYYYIDRYFYPSEPLTQREARRLEDLIRRDPGNAELRWQIALLYWEEGRTDDAIAQSKEAITINPAHEPALATLGNIYVELKRYQEALEPLLKVVDLNKENPYRLENKRLEAVYYWLGMSYLGLARPQEAVAALKEAVTIDRTDADAHYMLGNAYLQLGSYPEAVGSYRQATRFVFDFLEAYQGLTSAYEKMGDAARASYARGMVAFSSKNYDAAIAELQRATQALPDFADGFFGLGLAYERKGQKDKAIENYEATLRLDANHFLAGIRLQALRQGT